ncbi:MAG: DUF1330 domain-containing protein [Rhodovibrionaceae bacterium]
MAAYILAQVEVKNPEGYEDYKALAPASIEKYGGKYLTRGGTVEALEGTGPGRRVVLLEFADMEAAKAFYYSPEYQEAAKIRQANSEGSFWLLEGLE